MANPIHINAAAIIERSMNKIDPRLMNHGKRVGYLLYRVLRHHGWEAKRLRDIAFLGLLHDIGAYKTEELDQMIFFETKAVWAHSIYGFLFMKYFSPLKDLAPVLLYHHADVAQSAALDEKSAMLVRLFHLCDRVELLYLAGYTHAEAVKFLATVRDTLFGGAEIDMLLAAEITPEVWRQVNNDAAFAHLLYEMPMSHDAAIAFLKMVVYSIDFRSPQTLLHTFALTLVARKLAELAGLAPGEIDRIEVAALVHDIGKMGTPLHILESTGKLSAEDFAIMKNHVVMSEEILADNVDADILAMAVNHHEKIDGSGYPKQLHADGLPLADRIMCVADVLSALWGNRSYKAAWPKERVLDIIGKMRGGHLDAALVDLTVAHYEEIAESMARHAQPIEALYEAIAHEQNLIESALATGNYNFLPTDEDNFNLLPSEAGNIKPLIPDAGSDT